MRRGFHWLGTAVLVAAALSGCRKEADVDTLRAAYALGEAERWEEAMPLVKAYAQAYPEEADGHFLLGMAHLYAKAQDVAIGVCLGELELALALFEESGDLGILADHLSPNEFRVAVQRESAYAHIWLVQYARAAGVPVRLVMPRLELAMECVEKGLALDGDAERLLQIKERIEFYQDEFKKGRKKSKRESPE